MLHTHSLDELRLKDAYVTIGTFDGVHLGHRAILRSMIVVAHEAGAPAVVVTFSPPPGIMLRGITEGYALTGVQERAELLGQLGIDAVVTLPFDRDLAALSAAQFMSLLKESLGLKQLWVGYDFALGRGREGDIPYLRALGEEMGYTVEVIPPVNTERYAGIFQPGALAAARRQCDRCCRAVGAVVWGERAGGAR